MNQINVNLDSFFEGTILQQELNENIFTISIEDFSSMCMEAMYIIDFQKRCFHHVPCHNLFLCGYSREEVMQLGYDFYSETVHGKDLSLFIKMFQAILIYLKENQERQNDISYFSFTLRLKTPPSTIDETGYLMVYHKLKPIFINGILHFGICMLSCSVISKSGNLRVYFKNNPNFNEYSFDSEKWKNQQDERLTEQEILILWFSKQRICNKQIADKLKISYIALRHIKMGIYEKLGVETIEQAIIYATNHQMLFSTIVENSEKNFSGLQCCQKSKRRRNKLTDEKRYRIQVAIDNKQSINSIAKEMKVSEGAIRKAIKNGKMTKLENRIMKNSY
jgi:DNA-binding NarL/FixJ family response regulator